MKIKRDLTNLIHLIILRLKRRTYKSEVITKVRFIRFRHFFPHGGAGGGGAVQSANRVIFQDKLKHPPILFTF